MNIHAERLRVFVLSVSCLAEVDALSDKRRSLFVGDGAAHQR